MAKLYFRCYRCKPEFTEFAFEGKARDAKCPKCSAGVPAVVKLDLVHFLYEDPDGKVPGTDGVMWSIACRPGQPLRNFGLHAPDPATDHPNAVTCPACIESTHFDRVAKDWGIELDGGLKLCAGCG